MTMEAIRLQFKVRPVSISLLLHGLLAAIGFLIIFQSGEPSSKKKGEPIEIETVTKRPSAKKEKQSIARNTEKAAHSETANHEISLSSLAMRMDFSRPPPKAQDFYQPDPVERQAGEIGASDDWDLTNADPRLARFNLYVYNTVQGWLDRDGTISHEPLRGTVRIKIWFTADGEYLENETVFDAIDPNFEIIVRRALRKSFTNPIPKIYLSQNKKFFIERSVILRN